MRILILILLMSFSFIATAATHTPSEEKNTAVHFIDLSEFEALCVELAQKVTLFRDVWAVSPESQFFGGTTRDFIYWVRGQFRDVQDAVQARLLIDRLRALKTIDVRDFIVGDSDVDVIGLKVQLDPYRYGVKKIDFIDSNRFDPLLPEGQDELNQGFVPAEKIRLGKTGFTRDFSFGDGLKEIFEGQPTVHFADQAQFDKTHFAKLGLNHQILLALRYLRIIAVNYYYLYGKGLPNQDVLFKMLDPQSTKEVERIVQKTIASPTFPSLLKNQKFLDWLNQAIQKAFRSYTNPTAAYLLYRRFGIEDLIAKSDKIQTIHQYLFSKNRNLTDINGRLAEYGTTAEKFYSSIESQFEDGYIYHGTRAESSFRGILLQGFVPSSDGLAGAGLYGVSKQNLTFAERWGGSAERVVKFRVNPNATLVDISRGEGRRVFKSFGRTRDEFADYFGIDILRYPFEVKAFVVKNSTALGSPEGHRRFVLTYSTAIDRAAEISSTEELIQFIDSIELCNFLPSELISIYSLISFHDFNRRFLELQQQFRADGFDDFLESEAGARILESALMVREYSNQLSNSLKKDLAKKISRRVRNTLEVIFSRRPVKPDVERYRRLSLNLGQAFASQINDDQKKIMHQQLRNYLKHFSIITDNRIQFDQGALIAQGMVATVSTFAWAIYFTPGSLKDLSVPILMTIAPLIPMFHNLYFSPIKNPIQDYRESKNLARILLESFEASAKVRRTFCDRVMDTITLKGL